MSSNRKQLSQLLQWAHSTLQVQLKDKALLTTSSSLEVVELVTWVYRRFLCYLETSVPYREVTAVLSSCEVLLFEMTMHYFSVFANDQVSQQNNHEFFEN